ncbi:MAG: Squalene epoxidase [Phylliscum demangeonii]|nr:MAG: Squalene epoxidase [Phylliscum demangeonii]
MADPTPTIHAAHGALLNDGSDHRAWERLTTHHEADVIVVGAGIVGCAIAVLLGRQGRRVALLERSLKEPDRIVGELLQPGGVAALERLGLRDCLEGIDAIAVHGYEVIYRGEGVHIPYPAAGAGTAPRTRPQGRSFHHGRFVQRLRAAARATPNVLLLERKVTSLVESGGATGPQVVGVRCEAAAGGGGGGGGSGSGGQDCYFADLTIVCDGYGSRFRGAGGQRGRAPRARSKFYGLELRDAVLPRPQHGHVVLSPDQAPVLLYQIGTGTTRALVDVPEGTSTATVAAGGVRAHLRHVVLPSLPGGVQRAFAAALDTGPLRSMPNSFLPASVNRTPGLALLGDALNMRHPLTGGGMTVALHDALLLADLLCPGRVPRLDDTARVRRQLRRFHWRRKRLASVINVLAQALYTLFAANDPSLLALQHGCFRYFQRGGNCVDGPVGLLAGIVQQPATLVYHFFAVALYSVWIMAGAELRRVVGVKVVEGKEMEMKIKAKAHPWWLAPLLLLLAAARTLWTACVVLLPYLLTELGT